jgi:hypothetical protein
MDDVRIYDRALIPEEIRTIVSDVVSYSAAPNPADGATYVLNNVILSWKPGMFAHTHDVYFGTVLEDVSNASRVNPLSVLANQGQDANTYDPGLLEFDQTYFWRVNEVNAPPDLTIFQGDVWRFTVEPILYPIPGGNITATASSQFSDDQNPENTINGSGMDINELHSKSTSAMWLSDPSEPGSAWIQYDFNKVYELHEMLVWNYNGALFLPGYGFKDVTVEYSADGDTWIELDDVPEFAKATGLDGYAANTIVDFGGIIVKSVRITAHSNWGTSLFDRYGLSEVLFLATPFNARVPSPKNGARNIALDTTLSWIAGRKAAEHKVYISKDEQGVIEGTTAAVTVSQTNYGPLSLELATPYFWRVDEVNAPPDDTVFKSPLWSFTVEPYTIPITGENITVTASSYTEGSGPENTINGSGLVNDLHSIEIEGMWLTSDTDPGLPWIQYEFDKTYLVHEMIIWNYNGESILAGLGLKDVTIEYSTDGTNWILLNGDFEFPQATGVNGYASDITVDFGLTSVKLVKISATSNWLELFPQYGLSEVRFMTIPVSAREPSPESEATGVAINTALSWRAGREAVEHNVYISTDEQAVINGTAPVSTVTQASSGPLSLDLDTTYFWRVDEVNYAETIPLWEGDFWSFTTIDYLVVDDFESYNDIETGQEGSNLVYETWIDGYENPSMNGSTIGYVEGSAL